jgi:DNA-binding MarR family transcriptional regulator
MVEKSTSLRFDGSLWCNLDITVRNLDLVYRRSIRPYGITVIEWYILRALYVKDGQHASELARAVGRAATSFTPNLDKLQERGLIERRPDMGDRRAVRIFLTAEGQKIRESVLESAREIDTQIRRIFPQSDYEVFLDVMAGLQGLEPEN